MKLKATLTFRKEDIVELIKDTVTEQGYALCGDIEWSEEGGAHVEVRPMTVEEKEEAGLDPRNPMDVYSARVEDRLEDHLMCVKELLKDHRQVMVSKAAPLPSQDAPPASPPEEREDSDLVLITPNTYGPSTRGSFTPKATPVSDDEEDLEVSKARIERLRAEQARQPDIYDGRHRDENGFVVLKS